MSTETEVNIAYVKYNAFGLRTSYNSDRNP
jgi:hypothetical protein